MDGSEKVEVLLIEDNPGDARLIEEMLKRASYASFSLECVNNLAAGLTHLATAPVDAVLLDLKLPDSEGLDTLEQVRTAMPHIPIIVLTSLDSESIGAEAVERGAQDYLIKGEVPANLLARAIRHAIKRKQMEETLQEHRDHLEEMVKARTAELQQVNDLLCDSEERFRTVADFTYDWEYWVAPDGHYLYVSPASHRISGYSATEFMRNPALLSDIIHPDDHERIAVHLNEELAEHEAAFIDFRIITRDGATRWIEHVCQTVYDDAGNSLGRRASNRDVTARYRAERALRESEEALRAMLNAIQESAFLIDTEGTILQANETVARRFGMTIEEMLGVCAYDLVPPGVRERRRERGREVIQNGLPVRFEDVRFGRCVDNTVYPVFDERGAVARLAILTIDITERKRAEEELRVKDRAIETAISAVALADLEGILTYVNPMFLEMWGYDAAAEVVGKPTTQFWQSEDAAREVLITLQTQGKWRGELTARKKDGTKFYAQVIASVVLDEAGERVGMMASFVDVTARKRAAEARRLNEARLRALVDLNRMRDVPLKRIADFVLDNAVRLTKSEMGFVGFMSANEGQLDIHAWSKKAMAECQIVDKPLHFTIDEAGVWAEAVRQRRPLILNDYAAPHPQKKGYPAGHVTMRRLLSLPIFDGERIVAIIAVANKDTDYDETDLHQARLLMEGMWRLLCRRRAEEALRESERELQLTLDATTDGIWKWNFQTDELFFSPQYYRMLGYEPNEFAANYENWQNLIHPDDRDAALATAAKYLETKPDTYENEFRMRTKDGDYRWLHAAARVVERDENGEAVRMIGNHRDVTARRHASAALQQKNQELQRVNAELQRMAYAISHDVAAPLRVLKFEAEDIEKRCHDQLDDVCADSLRYIIQETKWMQRLVNDLREYSRVHSRGGEFAPVDCEMVMQRAIKRLHLDIEDQHGAVTHDALPTVLGDEAQLDRLFQNLISNALKFHGEELPRVHISALPSPRPSPQRGEGDAPLSLSGSTPSGRLRAGVGGEGMWLFAVRDNGIGIAEKDYERIFILFQRLHTRDEYDGTGMGLAICKRIVERHGGRMWVESEVGAGATFYFTLPRGNPA